MENLKNKFWNFFNGKKTVIGLLCMYGVMFINEVVIDIWAIDSPALPKIAKTLGWLGLIIGGGGLIHKGIKVKQEEK